MDLNLLRNLELNRATRRQKRETGPLGIGLKTWIPDLAFYYPTANRYLPQIGKEKISSDDLEAPFVYGIMGHFKDWSFVNPMTFVMQNERTVPIYPSEEEVQKRVINTRNPFSLGCDKRRILFGK